MLGIFGRKRKPETQAALDAELQDLQDMAELAESPDDFKQLAKSVTQLAVKAAKDDEADDETPGVGSSSGKSVDGDEDPSGDDYEGNDDDLGEQGEDGAGEEPAGSSPGAGSASPATTARAQGVTTLAPAGRRMEKSLRQAMEESGVPVAGLEAESILEAVSEGLLENNRTGLAILESLQKSLRMQARTNARLEAVETQLTEERSFNKSVRAFMKNIEQTPVGSPVGSAPYKPAEALSKGLSTPGGGEAFGTSVKTTLRGISESDLVKGLSQHLLGGKGDKSGLSVADLSKIGSVPMEQLNPKIAEVAAEELGLTLED